MRRRRSTFATGAGKSDLRGCARHFVSSGEYYLARRVPALASSERAKMTLPIISVLD
jgi:hypothetical protein